MKNLEIMWPANILYIVNTTSGHATAQKKQKKMITMGEVRFFSDTRVDDLWQNIRRKSTSLLTLICGYFGYPLNMQKYN